MTRAVALTILLALLGATGGGTAWAQRAPDSAVRPPTGQNPPHGQPGHVHGAHRGQAGATRPNPPHGQPGHVHGGRAPAQVAAGARDAAATRPTEGLPSSRAAAVMFWLFALLTVGGSLFVITRRNLVAAVMGMVGTFFALAALYAMLYAHFLAAIQVLVYAGAIMVLFVFVVMILNRPEEEPWALEGLLGKAVAGLAILYLLVRLTGVFWDIKDTPHAAVAGPAPRPVDTTGSAKRRDAPVATVEAGQLVAEGRPHTREDWGSIRSVGDVLFNEYLFPFEAISLLLLVAVVGGISVSRPHRLKDGSSQDVS